MGASRVRKNVMTKRHHPHINFVAAHRKAQPKPSRRGRKIFVGFLLGVAAVATAYAGVLFVGFYSVKFHLTDVPGVVDEQSQEYNSLAKSLFNVPVELLHLPSADTKEDTTKKLLAAMDACQLRVVRARYPKNAERIASAAAAGAEHATLAKMAFAIRLRDTDTTFRDALDRCTTDPAALPPTVLTAINENAFPWARREEWSVAESAFRKDASVVQTAGTVTGVEARMIVATGFVEQMRLYFTQREVYEKFFRPLRVLGNATQFAWGVMAIKETAAIDVEEHLRNPRSVFYLGTDREHALDFTSDNVPKERFARLTDEKNHLFSYLYGGFELAQYRAQWKRANFPIDDRPEILATLYNIGFGKSKPNSNPQVGGSTIHIADVDYTFGALAFEFYYSGEMLDVFPYSVPSS